MCKCEDEVWVGEPMLIGKELHTVTECKKCGKMYAEIWVLKERKDIKEN